MAGFSDTTEANILNLWLCAKAVANIADNAASSPNTATWVSLHTADPGDTGTAGTNELAATGYTRISVTRTTAGWTVSGGSAQPVAAITFPQLTSTSTGTITHAAIVMTSATTAGIIIASGAVSPNINFSQNVTPSLTTGSSFTLD
jgi:hypothetical protein